MALTLDPTLAAAQNSQSRHPLVEIISSEFAEDIPFDGQFLTAETTSEQSPNTIVHSTGRLILVYKFGTNQIKYVYTDTLRTAFSFITLNTSGTLQEVAVCELADGNVGILYRDVSGDTHYFRYRTVTPTGTLIASGDIVSFSANPTLSGPAVIRLADDSYLMVYVRLVSGDYIFYKMTSSNFTSWGSPSAVSVGGLTLTNEIENPYLHQITTGDIFLWFDYSNATNISNIYYSLSADGGSTWGNAVQVTSYATVAARAKHPVSAQKIAGQFFLFFNEQTSTLHANSLTDGWVGQSHGSDLTFDPVSRKLYVSSQAYAFTPWAVNEIDIDTWTVTRAWDETTTPAFPQGLNQSAHSAQGDGQMIPLFSDQGLGYVSLLNAADDAITTYCFADVPAYGLIQNVDHDITSGQILGVKVDMTARRFYVFHSHSGGVDQNWYRIGYIDLTEPGPIYHYTEIVAPFQLQETGPVIWSGYGFDIFPADDFILVWNECTIFDTDHCALVIHNLSTGAMYKRYQWSDTFPSFPWHGVKHALLVGNKVYATFTWHSTYSQEDKRGLCEVDILTDTVRYLRPTWASIDEYGLHDIHATADGRLIVTAHGYGITIFNPSGEIWELFNNTNLPGMNPGGGWDIYNFVSLAFDEANGMIFVGWAHNVYGDWEGVGAFSIYGFIKQSLYRVATYSGGTWNFGAVNDAVIGYQDYDLAAVFGPEATDGLIVFWTYLRGSEYSVKWDKEGLILNLNDYLAKGKEISIRRSIDGRPNELKFTVSHGHLFDPDNLASLLAPILEKGRKIAVRFGEKISGSDYWADQGIFTLNEIRMRYGRGPYPEMEVIALDRRLTWDHGQILATPYYSGDPEDVLTDLLTDFLGFTVAEIDIPAFDNSVPISHQWMECLPKDIIFQICNRFGYYPRITVQNKFSARKISNLNAVDHAYSDNTKLIDFTPDDSFSDFTNQIIVVGQEQNEIEIVYEEERIETLSGTIGWWTREKDYTIYYSKDMSRRCRNPRLVVIESSTSAPFQLVGRVSESISYVDPNEYYCIVTIEGPDLLPMLAAAIAIVVGAYLLGDMVVSTGYGWTVPVGRYIQMVGVILAIQILASVCNFQYEIWARPLGKVKRSLQGAWNDEALQAKIQAVILQKIEEPLCNSVPDCTAMANQEGLEVQLQRRRRQFSKVAHLQDEEGDTLQIPHPYTGAALKVFVTDLTRKMLVPARETDEGYFVDAIEGWRL